MTASLGQFLPNAKMAVPKNFHVQACLISSHLLMYNGMKETYQSFLHSFVGVFFFTYGLIVILLANDGHGTKQKQNLNLAADKGRVQLQMADKKFALN
jgi:hypothetical protein